LSDDFSLYCCRSASDADSRHLLRRAAAHFAGDFDLRLDVEEAPLGKPYFPQHPELCFSVTHSGDWWMCAIGARAVGLDLQVHECGDREAIARRFFHVEELAFLEERSFEKFFSVWAAKESYLKYTGEGISVELGDFSVVRGGSLADNLNGTALRHMEFEPGYSLCLCAQSPGRIDFVYGWE